MCETRFRRESVELCSLSALLRRIRLVSSARIRNVERSIFFCVGVFLAALASSLAPIDLPFRILNILAKSLTGWHELDILSICT